MSLSHPTSDSHASSNPIVHPVPSVVPVGSVPSVAPVTPEPSLTPTVLSEPACEARSPLGQPEHADESAIPPLCRTTVWNVPFDQVTHTGAVDRIGQLIDRGQPSFVITANLNYAMLHHREPGIRPITAAADLIVADGQPIVWRSKWGNDPLPERVAGSQLIYDLAERASREGWGIYFLGGEPGVAASCSNRLAELYPGLEIAGVESPPYRVLSDQEQQEQEERIRNSGAKILLVAFGQPKGERWIFEHYQRLGIPVSIQLGASFDFVAGTAKRAPRFWSRVGLEWAYRMISDPKRLVPRYTANAAFLIGALLEDWKRAVTSWGMGDWTADSHR